MFLFNVFANRERPKVDLCTITFYTKILYTFDEAQNNVVCNRKSNLKISFVAQNLIKFCFVFESVFKKYEKSFRINLYFCGESKLNTVKKLKYKTGKYESRK